MSGLFSLLDDVAALAKLAAANLDDVAAATGQASAKAAGVIVDDTAVTPQYLNGVSPDRELPIIRKIARGSLRNKILIILPLALLLSQFAPFLLPPLMILGGSYLAFEGMEKVMARFFGHGAAMEEVVAVSEMPSGKDTRSESNPDETSAPNKEAGAGVGEATEPEVVAINSEEKVVRDAVRTDLILSAEIMVIALNEVARQGILARTMILIMVALLITFLVYGVVALLVKMDDFGLVLARRQAQASQKIGLAIIRLMPRILAMISVIGIFAMVWVGGHIVAVSCADLGWHLPHHLIENATAWAGALAGAQTILTGIFTILGETITAFLIGASWGGILVVLILAVKKLGKILG